ncbi:MAG TPA: DUF885 domain-containing protein [Acidimicrobiia bacterium]
MPSPFEISDRLTEAYADLDPIFATIHGVAGREHLTTDYSPDGEVARTELFRSTRGELGEHLGHEDPIQRFATEVVTGWLDTRLAEHEAGKWSWDLNHIDSPFQWMCDVFDVMDKNSDQGWSDIASRLEGFPVMLQGYQDSLRVGLSRGEVAARRQVESVMDQASEAAGDESRFLGLLHEAERAGRDTVQLTAAVQAVRAACGEFAGFLRDSLLPMAAEADGLGAERYRMGVERFIGADLDLEETYAWGWDEVHRLREEMVKTAAEVDPGKSLPEVIDMLENDPARCAGTRDEFVSFVTAIQHQAISQLDGTHFDLTPDMKRITVSIAPPGGPLGASYVGPSEDWQRAGSIWYVPGARASLPYWQEVSTAYHEGFPGHHLQVCYALAERERLSRFQRMYVWYSGAGEGWALYAERLMDELGYFEMPEYRLGLLASQLFRATRVVVDIGNHLGYRIPDHAPLHAGEPWSYERAVDYMTHIGLQAPDVAESEVKRYLGWPAQAISYKVGEREILRIRSAAQSDPEFDLKTFHTRMLRAGAIRIDHLWKVMS